MDGADQLARQAAADPNAPAIVLEDRTISWGELNTRVDVCARRLATLGARAGKRIATTLEPSLDAAEILFALERLGGVYVPLPADAAEAHREVLVDRVQPDFVITPYDVSQAEPAEAFDRHTPADDDPRWIIFTSGTEGTPKGVVLTAGNLAASAAASHQALRLLPGDRWLACMPMHHVGGPSIFRRAAEVGFSVVPVAVFDPLLVMHTLEQTSATAMSLVPTMLARLVEAGWRGAPSLRFVLLGGGPASEPLLNAALDRRIPIAPTYGLTEAASQVTTLPPWESHGRLGSAGRPLPGVQIRIADHPEGPLPSGTPGRIWVSGPTVATDTIDGPLPREAGWLPTGDMGQMDAEGYLTVLGRIDDVIVTGGEKVIPHEVEACLLEHPDIADAAVLGLPDDEWGQRVVAAVVVREGAEAPDAGELRAYLKRELMYHKVPRQIVFVGELPRTGPGKIDRAALRTMLAGRS